ncbi:Hypothetical predicted protein [Octopus vulgaris]|uniref:Uncharacterized protein n=2 Tax=Octopus TaxID=6643 RepID=A0AA36BYD7_OCTVU|nr:protein FAM183B-like [Octopus sinensis]CAI9742923.1 Hypothetical predicted protein [Octopus vulgaris]
MAHPTNTSTLNKVNFEKNWTERVKKEKRHQQLFTNFSINPFKKIHEITGKPNRESEVGNMIEDSHFKTVIKRANLEPVKKYEYPQTESQEIGWITQPLVDLDRSDRRLQFPRVRTGITEYMEAVWLMKEQAQQ